MNLYTLRTNHKNEILNGKILAVAKNKETKHLRFADATDITKTVIWETTTVVNEEVTEDGIKFTTASGSVYDLVNVVSLIPTQATMTSQNTNAPVLINKTVIENRPIHYGDGLLHIQFEFDREITEEEFKEWLTTEHYRITPMIHPMLDHTILEGSGTTWDYKLVRVYTD